MPKSMYDFEQSIKVERSLKILDVPIRNKLFYEKNLLAMNPEPLMRIRKDGQNYFELLEKEAGLSSEIDYKAIRDALTTYLRSIEGHYDSGKVAGTFVAGPETFLRVAGVVTGVTDHFFEAVGKHATKLKGIKFAFDHVGTTSIVESAIGIAPGSELADQSVERFLDSPGQINHLIQRGIYEAVQMRTRRLPGEAGKAVESRLDLETSNTTIY